MKKPFSQACENNKRPILEVIKHYFANTHSVLEIGSGTGQHAVYFAAHLPQLKWQTSDRKENHSGIHLWLQEYEGKNLLPPLALDVTQPWPVSHAEGIFSANTSHIMSWQMNCCFFAEVGNVLNSGGYFCLYGPFNINGHFTSDSNERFDHYLRSQNAEMGIRNFEDLNALAEQAQLTFVKQHAMPANNMILVWQRN